MPAGLLLLIVAGAGLLLVPRSTGSGTPQGFRVEPLTNDPGFTGQPALSPDGRLLAYASDRSGPTTSGRPCGWSPDSSTLYLLLDTDGCRDLWGQKVDQSGRTVGKPFIVRHLHHTTGVSTSFGNAITSHGFLYEATRFTGNLWRLTPQTAK